MALMLFGRNKGIRHHGPGALAQLFRKLDAEDAAKPKKKKPKPRKARQQAASRARRRCCKRRARRRLNKR